jgi:hypothetical protein
MSFSAHLSGDIIAGDQHRFVMFVPHGCTRMADRHNRSAPARSRDTRQKVGRPSKSPNDLAVRPGRETVFGISLPAARIPNEEAR